MEHVESGWDFADVQNPRKPMSGNKFAANSNLPIPLYPFVSRPKPASIGTVLVDLAKKRCSSVFRKVDFPGDWIDAAVRFVHNVLSVMSGFSSGRSASTGAHCDYAV